jgi:hypothetical protein
VSNVAALAFAYAAKMASQLKKGDDDDAAVMDAVMDATYVLFVDIGSHVTNAGVASFTASGRAGTVLSACSTTDVGSACIDGRIADHVEGEALRGKAKLDISGNLKVRRLFISLSLSLSLSPSLSIYISLYLYLSLRLPLLSLYLCLPSTNKRKPKGKESAPS